jgi:hypothetical protein
LTFLSGRQSRRANGRIPVKSAVSSVKRKRRLPFMPIDHVEDHTAFQHFSLKIGGMFLSGVSLTRNRGS